VGGKEWPEEACDVTDERKNKNGSVNRVGIGAIVGVALGTAVGMVLGGLAQSVAFGLVAGMSIGAVLDFAARRSRRL